MYRHTVYMLDFRADPSRGIFLKVMTNNKKTTYVFFKRLGSYVFTIHLINTYISFQTLSIPKNKVIVYLGDFLNC